ncbi:MAG: response regulator [Burkholderiales bacterium]|nr:response regulator [Burkholderiales bacterium]
MKLLRDLFAQFNAYHDNGRPFVQYTGMVGVFAFPLFYLLRFTKGEPPYNDLWLRGLASTICLGLALKDYWPERAKPYYMAYAYGALLFCLPFFFFFTSLANGGGVVAVANTLMAVFFLILLSDWRNTIVMLLSAMLASYVMFLIAMPGTPLPMDYVARLPIGVLVVVGGSLFKFAEKRAEADKLRRTYTALAGSIAHEVRNPLSQVRMALDSIERALPAPTPDDSARPLALARVDELYRHLSAGQMAVERGLQVITLTLGEVRTNAFSPGEFVLVGAAGATRRAIEEYGYDSALQRERVQLDVRRDFVFRGDETAYLFILFNLIRNALYYFETHPHARLTVTVDAPRVIVRDTGPGMSPEALRHLFEPFRTSGKSDGTGLGLSYCRRAMRAFGGDIVCRSVQGEFTEFELGFTPVADDDVRADEERSLAAAREALRGRRVMVVDDDEALRRSAARMLSSLGCSVIEAEGGETALALLLGMPCDALLLDLKMPGLDGFAVAARLRGGAVPGCEDLPIVALTSEPAHIVLPKTRKVGMNGFVAKPATPLLLAAALGAALHPVARGSRPLAGRTVLLAEDSTYSRSVMRAQLQQWGARVLESWSGESALEHVLAQDAGALPIDAALMDLNMPGQGGLAATRAIRQLPDEWGRLPVIALTGHADAGTVSEAIEAGFDDYLVKPVEPAALLERLQQHLAQRPARQVSGAPAADAAAARATPAAAISLRAPSGASAVAPGTQPSDIEIDAAQLLDPARLEQLRSVDMIDEGLPLYLAQMHAQIDRLDEAHAENDFSKARDALHSLVGASGDSGAQLLHRASRAIYPLLLERHWPADPQWLGRLRALARATDDAMHARYLRSPPDSGPR